MTTRDIVQHNILSLSVYTHLYLLFAYKLKPICVSLCSIRICVYMGVFFYLHESIEIEHADVCSMNSCCVQNIYILC